MSSPRNLIHVLEDILDVIPYFEYDLVLSLKSIKNGLPYCPPEVMGSRWVLVHNQLFNHEVNLTDKEWKIKVLDIWMNSENLTTNNID